MSVSTLYPDSKPTFKVNLKKSKRLPSKFTFTRSSTGTYVDRNGLIQTAETNKPRFDHDPLTGECKGLLIEEARTNLLLRSEEFDNASWTKTNTTIAANAGVAPNGTATADKITEDATSSAKLVSQIVGGFISGTTYTISAFIKPDLSRGFSIGFSGVAFLDERVRYNASGNFVAAEGAPLSYGLRQVGSFYYVWVTAVATASGNGQYRVWPADANGTLIYTGDGTSGIYIWGAQLEAGEFPTSYIPTTGTTATRNADVCTITGSNFSRWYNQSEGTVYVHALSPRGAPVGFSDGTTTERFRIIVASTALVAFGTSSGSTQFNISTAADSWISPSEGKGVLSLRTNDISAVANGGSVVTDTSASLPFVNRAIIGASQVGSYINGSIAHLTYWPRRLPDSNLQNLTKT